MAKRYQIWDKTSPVITPIGEVLKPDQWIAKRPIAGVEGILTVVAGGVINGAFFGVYEEMLDYYGKLGCDFSECSTEQDCLDAIEAFEDAMNTTTTASAEERIASALEAQVMMAMPDDETVEE